MEKTRYQMGLTSLSLVSTSNMLGSGVFLLPASLAGIGSIGLWGWLITIIGVLALALAFSKTSFLTPAEGGIVSYARSAFGPFIGFQMTFSYWITAWVGNVALLIAGVGYLSYFFPWMKSSWGLALTAIVFLWLFTFFSALGARTMGRFQSITTIAALVVILGIGFLGWFWVHPQYYFDSYNVSGKSDFRAIMHAAALVLWGFLGVESATVSTGVVRSPKRTVPLATIIAVLLASLCYVSSTASIMGIVPHDILVNSDAPFADAARYMFGDLAGKIVSAVSVVACFGSLPGWLILQSEAPKAAAKNGLFPKFFGKTTARNVPLLSLIFTSALMSCVLLMMVSPTLITEFNDAILLSAFTSLLPYLFAVSALPIIMRRFNTPRKEAILYWALVFIGAIYSIYALLGTGSASLFWGTGCIVLTIPLYIFVSATRTKEHNPL